MNVLTFNCRHDYGGAFRLDVSFEADRPVTCLFGPSGSGKTTILNIIAGAVVPRCGRITLCSRDLTDSNRGINLPPEKRQVGVVFQDYLLFPHMSVAANLRFGRRRGRDGPAIEMDRVVEVLEIGHLLARSPWQLSGGENQRVALGRALLSRPRLLLLDEPLASLDDALKGRILDYLQRVVAEWNIPAVFVTHAQADVRRLADWVVVLQAGAVVAQGQPDEALGQPAALGLKRSAGPANLLRIEHVNHQEGRCVGKLGDQDIRLPASTGSGTPLYVQFSPSDVTLARQPVAGLSARNHLSGTIRQVVDVPGSVFVAVDAGQIIWAEVTRDAVNELQLQPGAHVICYIKTQSLQVVGE